MSDNKIEDTKKVNRYKNDMLVSYKDLVEDYEDCRKIYEKIIYKYTSTVRQCSQIIAYVVSSSIINWRIVLTDGRIAYSSENKLSAETCIIDISKLGLTEGTQFKLQAYKSGSGPYSDDTLEYKPLSNTLYFSYDTSGDGTGNNVFYRDTIESPFSPPIVKCSKVSAIMENAPLVAKYELRRVDGGGTVYTSGKYSIDGIWSKELDDLNLPVGTQLILHANVSSGDDSEPYVIIQYDYNDTTAEFTLVGTAFKTMFMVG